MSVWFAYGALGLLVLGGLIYGFARHQRRYQRWLAWYPEAIVVVDQAGVILYANAQAAQLSACLPSKLVGTPITRWLLDSDSYAPVWKALFAANDTRASGSLGQYRWQALDGHITTLLLNATALPRDKGVLLVLRLPHAQHPDQPQHYLAEKLLKTAESDAGIGSWVLHMGSGRLEWSQAVHHIFGTDPTTFLATEEAYFQCVHPDDRERVRRELDRHMQGSQPFDVEYRIVRPDGQIRHLLERNHVHRLDSGHIDHLWGTVIDMTEHNRLKSQLQLSQLAVEHSSEGIAIADAAMNWLYVNPALRQMCGLDGRSTQLSRPQFLLPGLDSVLSGQDLLTMLAAESHWHGELRVMRQSRTLLPVLVSVTRLADGDGEARSVWVLTDISHIKEVERKLRSMAFFDGLTGLANRTQLSDQLRWQLQEAAANKRQLAIAFFDLNGFKQINDELGHEEGDQVLCEVALQLQAVCRPSDLVARWGGDEFAVLLPDGDDEAALYLHLKRLERAVQIRREAKEVQMQVTASVGVALYPWAGHSAEQLMQRADQAMYCAKEQGRGDLWLHDAQGLRPLSSAPCRAELSDS